MRKFSYSQLTKFYQCELAWYLRYEEKLEEVSNIWATLGSFCHDIIERLVKNEITQAEAVEEFKEGWRQIAEESFFPFNDKKLKNSYYWSLLEYFQNYKPFKGEPFDVELKFELPIGEDILVGLIDLPIRHNGKVFIIDHKISTPYAGKKLMENKRQLYVYAEAIKQKYGAYPDGLMYNYFKAGEKYYEPFNPEFHRETMNWVKLTIEKIKRAKTFEANFDPFFCANLCGLREQCPVFTEKTQ